MTAQSLFSSLQLTQLQLLFGKSRRSILYFFGIFIRAGEDSKMNSRVLLQAQGNNILNIRLKTKNYIAGFRNKISIYIINSPQIVLSVFIMFK